MKIGIIGNGAREAAMFLALYNKDDQILTAGTKINPQISHLAQWNIATDNPWQLTNIIENWGAEIVLIGPESYLTAVDATEELSSVNIFEQKGTKVAAPSYLPSLIELDKTWMISLLTKYGMKKLLPRSSIFSGARRASHINGLINKWKDVAIKPVGLTGGKGVKVTGVQLGNITDAKKYARELLQEGQTVIVQQKLTGLEFSLQAFVDINGHMIFAPLVQDFKKLYDDDGNVSPNPNTGSMGSISYADGLLPFVSETIFENAREAMRNIVTAIIKETGDPYKGPIYGQFMVTSDNNLAIIEVNARLGDPEAINILSLLPESKFMEICQGIINGNLDEIEVNFRKRACVVKYIVPIGYPGNSQPVVIKIRKAKLPVKLYYGGVARNSNGDLITTGSRAIAVAAEGDNISEAVNIVNKAIPQIFANCIRQVHWRPGIGLEQ